jgi:hypothetical protein
MNNHLVPIVGFEGRDDACGDDAQPLIVRWKNGPVIGGILAQLDPAWLKARQADLARDEELRSQGVTILADHRRFGNEEI